MTRPCPPKHAEYGSQMLADNMVTLHFLQDPACPGYNAFRCGDHWHVGHTSRWAGERCRELNGSAARKPGNRDLPTPRPGHSV